MARPVTIYALAEPDTCEVRYVGKTIMKPEQRLRGHLNDRCVCHRTKWLKSLKSKPKIIVLQVCDELNWEQSERFWIAYYRSIGAKLVNQTFGGDGPGKFHPEVIAKISAGTKGKNTGPCSENRRIAISLAKKGRPNGLNGRKYSAEHRLNVSLALRGKPSPTRGTVRPREEVEKRRESRLKTERIKVICKELDRL
jgi:hypothetical protein